MCGPGFWVSWLVQRSYEIMVDCLNLSWGLWPPRGRIWLEIPKVVAICWVTLELRRSCCHSGGTLGGQTRDCRTLENCAFSVQVEKTSIHPVKISMKTNKYLWLFPRDMLVNYICHSSRGYKPLLCTGVGREGGLMQLLGLFCKQNRQDWVTTFIVVCSFLIQSHKIRASHPRWVKSYSSVW